MSVKQCAWEHRWNKTQIPFTAGFFYFLFLFLLDHSSAPSLPFSPAHTNKKLFFVFFLSAPRAGAHEPVTSKLHLYCHLEVACGTRPGLMSSELEGWVISPAGWGGWTSACSGNGNTISAIYHEGRVVCFPLVSARIYLKIAYLQT